MPRQRAVPWHQRWVSCANSAGLTSLSPSGEAWQRQCTVYAIDQRRLIAAATRVFAASSTNTVLSPVLLSPAKSAVARN